MFKLERCAPRCKPSGRHARFTEPIARGAPSPPALRSARPSTPADPAGQPTAFAVG